MTTTMIVTATATATTIATTAATARSCSDVSRRRRSRRSSSPTIPRSRPGRFGLLSFFFPPPRVDSVTFTGTGKWNGKAGYTFTVTATDKGEPGRRRDTFSLIVKDATGKVVTSVDDVIDGGNIQSTRLLFGWF